MKIIATVDIPAGEYCLVENGISCQFVSALSLKFCNLFMAGIEFDGSRRLLKCDHCRQAEEA